MDVDADKHEQILDANIPKLEEQKTRRSVCEEGRDKRMKNLRKGVKLDSFNRDRKLEDKTNQCTLSPELFQANWMQKEVLISSSHSLEEDSI